MTRRLTVAERHAAVEKDLLLTEIASRSSWDQFLVEQALFAVLRERGTASANDLRVLLPELGRGFLGAAITAMRAGGLIQHTGETVPSTLDSTNGHRLAVWQLTNKGIAVATRNNAARRRAA
ncbi:hypothetical protein ADK55_18500 [Streptomyces sp. WM4235]|uniref:hypothetical protein n=1 Tax=Streptomyces sp. WM4235 TaxID=1415551 RepID=UPI0006AFDCDF|nr:hypothetical protein [Streptomyces sp. WM4235]KOU50539.1 hypothetical protein ADK55_18500 [Streptomyces sp. WM4235]